MPAQKLENMLGKIKILGFSLFPVALLIDFHFFDDVNVLLHAEQGNDFSPVCVPSCCF